MVKIFFIALLISQSSFAEEKVFVLESKIPELTARLKSLNAEGDAQFEDQFSKVVKELDQVLEKEKNICIGELSTEAGEIVSKEGRQVCLRTIKGHYLASLNQIHLLKKKYMTAIHQKQLTQLDENFEKLKVQFEKNF